MNILQFFQNSLKSEAKWVLFDQPLEAHEIEILRKILKSQKKEFSFQEIPSDGPSADMEAAFTSLDFFSPAKVFYLHIGSKSKWDTLAETRWKRILDLSDSQGNWLFISTDDAKLAKAASFRIDNSPYATSPDQWVNFFNDFIGAALDKRRLDFLVQQAPDSFLDFYHWVELWKLGGDEWAMHALGWGDKNLERDIRIQFSTSKNPAYDWVDAALAGRKDIFLKLSADLIEKKGEDPLRLWGLLGKSLKISAQLGMGENVVGEAPFLVTKLKKVKFRPELLDWWCKCDLSMKSTRADVIGLLSQIP